MSSPGHLKYTAWVCPLCERRWILKHILSCCPVALGNGWYCCWRNTRAMSITLFHQQGLGGSPGLVSELVHLANLLITGLPVHRLKIHHKHHCDGLITTYMCIDLHFPNHTLGPLAMLGPLAPSTITTLADFIISFSSSALD